MNVWDGRVGEDKMGLGTDAIDGNAIGNETLSESDNGIYLRTGIVKVVVVDVKLRRRVCFLRGAESNVDELGPEDVVEDGGSPGPVIIEDFVDNVLFKVKNWYLVWKE